MILICKECHRSIENNQERKPKTKYKVRTLTFCYYCGARIEFKRDRIGPESFHPECTKKFIKSPCFMSFIDELE